MLCRLAAAASSLLWLEYRSRAARPPGNTYAVLVR